MNGKFYITTPIYYVNAKPHIGHAYTTLAADVLARWHRFKGDEVFFLTGTDEHGSKIAEAAEVAGKSPQEFADETAGLFQKTWQNLNIEYSDFIRTTEERHKKGVAEFMLALKNKGDLYEGNYQGLYCTGCENFITEKELENGLCPIHKKAPEQISEKNWFFRLQKYLPQVKELIQDDKIKIRPESAKKEALGLIKQGLEDFSVTREKVKWGIKLPWDGSQTIYVWVEALQNYITARGYPDLAGKWPADLQLIGKDIIKFHAIYWPALLLSAGLEPPRELFVHGYFSINGAKMSKSLGNVIDPNALVKEYGVDATRYLLLSQFPFGQDGDVKAERFKEQYNSDLANGLGNLVSRVFSVVGKNRNILLSDRRDAINRVSTEKKKIKQLWQEVENHFQNKALEEVLKVAWRLIAESDKLVEREKIWELPKKDPKRAGQVFYTLLENIRHIALILEPFLPFTAGKILKTLGAGRERVWGGLPEKIRFDKIEPLFPRL